VQGGGDADAYLFRHWHAVDALVYFSHRLVTIPPPGWVNAGHTHGAQVLGTLITEWGAGAAACAQMFASQESAERVAAQLARVAERLGFDGWVINIENAVDAANVRHLFHFLCCLTAAMHAAVPGSKVNGDLRWMDRAHAAAVQLGGGACRGESWSESTCSLRPEFIWAAAGHLVRCRHCRRHAGLAKHAECAERAIS
jgi:endo-beta-N-acetylglucosaminidase D